MASILHGVQQALPVALDDSNNPVVADVSGPVEGQVLIVPTTTAVRAAFSAASARKIRIVCSDVTTAADKANNLLMICLNPVNDAAAVTALNPAAAGSRIAVNFGSEAMIVSDVAITSIGHRLLEASTEVTFHVEAVT